MKTPLINRMNLTAALAPLTLTGAVMARATAARTLTPGQPDLQETPRQQRRAPAARWSVGSDARPQCNWSLPSA